MTNIFKNIFIFPTEDIQKKYNIWPSKGADTAKNDSNFSNYVLIQDKF